MTDIEPRHGQFFYGKGFEDALACTAHAAPSVRTSARMLVAPNAYDAGYQEGLVDASGAHRGAPHRPRARRFA